MANHTHKILIVDDEEDILEFLSYNLNKEGYQVFTATDGNTAITLAKKELPHLILLDVIGHHFQYYYIHSKVSLIK